MIRSAPVYICLLTGLIALACFAAQFAMTNEEIDPRKILLIFYYCDSNETSVQCIIKDTDCIQSAYNQVKMNKNETTVYVHGYLGGRNTIPTPGIVSAYCSRNISVIVIVEWTLLARDDIILVSNRIPKIGQIIAPAFNSLNNKGYGIRKWHLIGHSMGAHIVGCIGTYSDFTFSHITGLDPAEINFYSDMYKGCRFNPKVAYFTDAFYTDRGGYATVNNVGILNIFANIGTAPQPGCCSSKRGVRACSHIKAAEWYADAVRNETKYLATKCVDCLLFQLYYDHCKDNDGIYLGPHIDTKTTGTYCLPID